MKTLICQLLEWAGAEDENWLKKCLSLPSGAEAQRTDEEPTSISGIPREKREEQRRQEQQSRQEEEGEPSAVDSDPGQRNEDRGRGGALFTSHGKRRHIQC